MAEAGCSTAILGSCNGLICTLNSESDIRGRNFTFYEQLPIKNNILPKIALWNPSTKEQKNLRIEPIKVAGLESNGFVTFGYAFGYDSVNNDYKVLRIVRLPKKFDGCSIEVKFYSLKTNSWREIVEPSYGAYIFHHRRNYVLIHKAFHWLLSRDHEIKIVAFDIQQEEFCTVPLANLGGPAAHCYSILGVLRRCLCLASFGLDNVSDIWVMNEHGMKDSCVKFLSLHGDNSPEGYIINPMPLATYSMDIKDDHDMDHLGLLGKNFIWYDLKRRKYQLVGIHYHLRHSKPYVASLVSPFIYDGGRKINDKKKRRGDE